jgi:hypothetical protein
MVVYWENYTNIYKHTMWEKCRVYTIIIIIIIIIGTCADKLAG